MRTALIATAALSGLALAGCGPAPSTVQQTATNSSQSAPSNTGGSTREARPETDRQVVERTDAQGRKWLGDVPYDVFFDDPLAMAAEGRPTTPTAPGRDAKPVAATDRRGSSPAIPANSAAAPSSEKGPSRSAQASTASGGAAKTVTPTSDWAELIDPELLDSEVKHIRTDLTAGLQSVGKYNTRYQEIAVSAATLAALSEIVVESPRSTSWKEHAANVRDLASAIHDSAKAVGGQAYQATKTSSEQLMDVLDGNIPAGLAAADPARDFSQVANRSALMKRMDHSYQRLKKGGPAQQLLKKDSGQVLEDAAILAVLSRVISVGHYDSADDPKYHTHATELTHASTDLATAARAGEATAFADALTRIQKRCDACHADFRF